MKVKALTTFFGNEGMWREGDSKEVHALRATELLQAGLVVEENGETEGAQAPEVSSSATENSTEAETEAPEESAATPEAEPETRETKPRKSATKLETK